MNSIKTTLLLAGLTALLLLFGHLLGGQNGMVFALILAAAMNIGAYWFSDTLVLKMYKAQRLDGSHDETGLYSIVQILAQRGNCPMPKVYIIRNSTPNAFATGRNPNHAAVAATTGIIHMLTREELMGVMAHEMTHVRNRDTLISAIAATLGGAIAMLANIAQFAMLFGGRNSDRNGGHILSSLLLIILAPIAAALIQMAVSRSREFAADAGGARLSGNPLWLASALQKLEQANQRDPMHVAEEHPATAHLFIVNPLHKASLRKLFSTHPPTALRVKKLKEMNITDYS